MVRSFSRSISRLAIGIRISFSWMCLYGQCTNATLSPAYRSLRCRNSTSAAPPNSLSGVDTHRMPRKNFPKWDNCTGRVQIAESARKEERKNPRLSAILPWCSAWRCTRSHGWLWFRERGLLKSLSRDICLWKKKGDLSTENYFARGTPYSTNDFVPNEFRVLDTGRFEHSPAQDKFNGWQSIIRAISGCWSRYHQYDGQVHLSKYNIQRRPMQAHKMGRVASAVDNGIQCRMPAVANLRYLWA